MSVLQQSLVDFMRNAGEMAFMFGFFMALFYLLFAVTRKNTSRQYADFTRADTNDRFISRDFRLEFSYFLLNKAVVDLALSVLASWLTILVMNRFFPHHIFGTYIGGLPFYAQVAIGLFIADAASFFPHWFSHKFLWRFHSIHHSAEKLSWLTAARLHPVDQVPFVIGGAVIMHIFGFEGESITSAIALHSFYNLFVHANIALDYPKPVCYILGSPNYHRWHHAADKEAIDKNFATMFPVFDLVFGSYYYPRGRLPESYGLYGREQQAFPRTLGKQLLYPFKRKKKGER